MQIPRRLLSIAIAAAAFLCGHGAALGCPTPTAADFAGYWRYAGTTEFMGSFERASGNSGIEFRDGVAYDYENGRKSGTPSRYTVKDGKLRVQRMVLSLTYFFPSCDRNKLNRPDFTSVANYRRARRP